MSTKMTKTQAMQIYVKCFPGDSDAASKDDPRRATIACEIREVCKAQTVKDAAGVIAWWSNWGSDQELHGAIRRIRNAARKMGCLDS